VYIAVSMKLALSEKNLHCYLNYYELTDLVYGPVIKEASGTNLGELVLM
jgi:hypothetical protein